MSMHYMDFDRAQKFEAGVSADPRDGTLKLLKIKGFDTVQIRLTESQLREIGKAIAADTGDAVPF